MTIDVISYTDEQLARLTAEQLLEVKQAQVKKNKLLRALEADEQAEKRRLIERGTFLSGLWEQYCEELRRVCDEEVQAIRDALSFYLRFSNRPSEGAATDAPYTVDYSLTETERAKIVKEYYEGAYADGKARFDAFAADEVAKQYLGEKYAAIYDYFYGKSLA